MKNGTHLKKEIIKNVIKKCNINFSFFSFNHSYIKITPSHTSND